MVVLSVAELAAPMSEHGGADPPCSRPAARRTRRYPPRVQPVQHRKLLMRLMPQAGAHAWITSIGTRPEDRVRCPRCRSPPVGAAPGALPPCQRGAWPTTCRAAQVANTPGMHTGQRAPACPRAVPAGARASPPRWPRRTPSGGACPTLPMGVEPCRPDKARTGVRDATGRCSFAGPAGPPAANLCGCHHIPAQPRVVWGVGQPELAASG